MKWILLLILVSCAQVTSLNLKKHQFGILPTKIIWLQVAGLQEEQVAMLRFQEAANKTTAFEENLCLGKTWSYNLYQLRTSAESAFMSQMTGKKNIKHSCEDVEMRPIWNYISSNGYVTGIFESGAKGEESLTSYNKCGQKGVVFLSSLYYWTRSAPVPNGSTFHYAEEIPLEANQLVFDRTCNAKNCGSSILDDFKGIYTRFRRSSHKHLFIVRDFSYLHALENKDFQRAREILLDLERTYASALKIADDSNDYLVLLTTGDSLFVDMPDQGMACYDFEKDSKNVQVKRTMLMNTVLASGARAENFCGIYDDNQVFERILSGPKQQGLELKIINPFK
jgi:hypothetical protein